MVKRPKDGADLVQSMVDFCNDLDWGCPPMEDERKTPKGRLVDSLRNAIPAMSLQMKRIEQALALYEQETEDEPEYTIEDTNQRYKVKP